MKHGQAFNPYRMFRGAMIPAALLAGAVSKGAAALYGQLGRYAGQDGLCFPKHARLAKDLGISERSVRRLLAELKSAGLVAVENRPTGRAKQYVFLWNSLLETGQLPLVFRSEMSGLDRTEMAGQASPDLIPEESHLKESHSTLGPPASVEEPAFEENSEASAEPSAQPDEIRLSNGTAYLVSRTPELQPRTPYSAPLGSLEESPDPTQNFGTAAACARTIRQYAASLALTRPQQDKNPSHE